MGYLRTKKFIQITICMWSGVIPKPTNSGAFVHTNGPDKPGLCITNVS